MKAVILAGGAGTRLWPVSRRQSPKQFHALIGSVSLIEQTRMRLRHIFADSDIYFAVGQQYAGALRAALPDVLTDHILIEPERRDTGPAIGLAAATLSLTSPDEPIIFLASDHCIRDEESFAYTIQLAGDLVTETGKFVNVGVRPSHPSTQLGYLRLGKQMEVRDGVAVYQSLGQTEKPNAAEAKRMMESGEYLWNCAYFTWTPRHFLDAYEKYVPQLAGHLHTIQKLLTEGRGRDVPGVYQKMEKISVDYALMEHLKKEDALVLAGTFDWDDVGLWSSVKKLQQQNQEANVESGASVVSLDTKDCLISGQEGKVIATIGLDHIVIVDTPDALLVCAKNRSDEVKRIVEELEERKLDSAI